MRAHRRPSDHAYSLCALRPAGSRRLADIAGHDRERLNWADRAPTGSPREGPEYAPKPPFHRRREIGFADRTGHKEASAAGVIESLPRRFLLSGNLGGGQIRGLV